MHSFLLNLCHPRTSKATFLVLEWYDAGWRIHLSDGPVNETNSECIALAELIESAGFDCPSVRSALHRIWCDLDQQPLDTPPTEEMRSALNQLAHWIEETTDARPDCWYFNK